MCAIFIAETFLPHFLQYLRPRVDIVDLRHIGHGRSIGVSSSAESCFGRFRGAPVMAYSTTCCCDICVSK